MPETYRQGYLKIAVLLAQHDDNNINNRLILNANQVELKDLNLQLTSGVEEELESIDFVINPNPASEYLDVNIKNSVDEAFISDAQGKLVSKLEINEGVSRIYTSDLLPGIYNLSIHYNRRISTKRFVINRE